MLRSLGGFVSILHSRPRSGVIEILFLSFDEALQHVFFGVKVFSERG
jgi:hypothetical protein